MAQFYKLAIKEIKKETKNAVSITFDVPENLKSNFPFVAGQYITIKKELGGKELRRAYSICSEPSTGELKVAIKAVDNGTFSVYATTILKQGDILEVSKPEGRFVLDPKATKNYIAFAAGSGITPVMAMLKSALKVDCTFTLIYGNKTEKDTIFKEELDLLIANNPNLNVHYIFSKENVDKSFFGRINTGTANYFLKNKYKNTAFDEAFLCGPENMIQTVTKTLIDADIDKENIHYELFSVAVDDSSEKIETPKGTTEITILLDDEETTFMMKQQKNILEVSLEKDLDAPYSCQGGVCSSCLCRVTKGAATMVKNEILTGDEVESGLILACQAHPTTATITVDFDDV